MAIFSVLTKRLRPDIEIREQDSRLIISIPCYNYDEITITDDTLGINYKGIGVNENRFITFKIGVDLLYKELYYSNFNKYLDISYIEIDSLVRINDYFLKGELYNKLIEQSLDITIKRVDEDISYWKDSKFKSLIQSLKISNCMLPPMKYEVDYYKYKDIKLKTIRTYGKQSIKVFITNGFINENLNDYYSSYSIKRFLKFKYPLFDIGNYTSITNQLIIPLGLTPGYKRIEGDLYKETQLLVILVYNKENAYIALLDKEITIPNTDNRKLRFTWDIIYLSSISNKTAFDYLKPLGRFNYPCSYIDKQSLKNLQYRLINPEDLDNPIYEIKEKS